MNELRRRIDEELSDFTFESIPECKRKAPRTTGKDKKMTIKKKALAICAAAIVAVGGALTAGAVNGWDYSRLISGFFPDTKGNESAVQAQILSSAIQTIDPQNITNTFENFDVEFDGALYDGTVLMISATVKNKDGSPFADGEYDFKSIRFSEGTGGGSGGCSLNDDGSLRVYLSVMYNAAAYPTAEYTFEGLCRYPDDPARYELLDNGSLSVEFDVDASCETRSFMLTDYYGNVIEAQLSPISLKLIMPKNVPEEELFKYKHFTISDENGVLISPQDIVFGCGDYDPQTGIENHIRGFARPIDINSVTAITGEAYISE
ncbi:MAG: hypothetical protein ACI4KM_12030 [Oscillospiraceae bacterium]